MKKEIKKLSENCGVETLKHCVGEFITNMFRVPKKTGDLRPVINVKTLSVMSNLS